MRNINKEIFLNAAIMPHVRVVVKIGTIVRSKRRKSKTLGEKFRMEQGNEIHKRARELFPDGLLIDNMDFERALRETKAAMDASAGGIIFDGAFLSEMFAARTDILKREK